MDERGTKRVVVDLELHARLNLQIMRALVYDLSIDGCMIEIRAGRLPEAGGFIELPLPYAGATEGTLAWTHGRYGGVRFANPLHEALVEHLGFKPERDPGPVMQDQFGRPVLGRKRHSSYS